MNALIGRDAELRRASEWLTTAATGRCVTGVVRGEPGAGKSTFARAVRDLAAERDVVVLATQGRVGDAELGFASLLTLLRPVAGDLDDLGGEYAPDVRAALALARSEADPLRVRLGVFRIVAALAERSAVALVIDDADQLDVASAQALAFALGHLDGDRVFALCTGSEEMHHELEAVAQEQIVLGPLDDASLARIVAATADCAVAVRTEVVRRAAGNPLAATELAASLTNDERSGRAPFPSVPRPTTAMHRGFAARLANASEAARRALVVVAADGTEETATIVRALEVLGEPDHGLDDAETAGLLTREAGRVRLVHPLLRAVAYHQVAPASRRAAHRALAAALDRPDAAAARALQLAAAADGPDEHAADALTRVAADATRRGAPASAARTLEQAAVLSADPNAAQRRLAAAAQRWLAAGENAHAAEVGARAGTPTTPDVAAVLARVALHTAGPVGALDVLDGASHSGAVEHGWDDALRAEYLLAHGDVDLAGDTANAVRDSDDPSTALLATAVLMELGACNDVDAERLAAANATTPIPATIEGAYAKHCRDALSAARVAVGIVDERDDVVAAFGRDLHATLRAARADLVRGRVLLALDRLAARAALASPGSYARDLVDLAAGEAELLLGHIRQVPDTLDAIVSRAHARQDASLAAAAQWLHGRSLLAVEGPSADAEASLLRAARLFPIRYTADAVHVLVERGRDDAARELVLALPSTQHAGPLLRARAWRAAGLAHLDRSALDTALRIADTHGLVVEAIEIAQAMATVARRRDDARAATAARDLLAARTATTDVRLYFGVAAKESSPSRIALRSRLSGAELRVAQAVTSGGTNRQIAEGLFLSVKTVDFHLQQIYRKLGVRSRTELAVLVSQDPDLAEPVLERGVAS